MLSLEESIEQSITRLKKSDYKTTAIKVELEAELNREWDEEECEDWIRDRVSNEARESLVYGNFYEDGSVDSEFTFTVMLENVRYIPEFIQAFKDLGNECGNNFDTHGAGMHIAVLNSRDGRYPRGNEIKLTYFNNFAKTMNHLMPGLFFLGSADYRSRGLGYRLPKTVLGEKYNAIHGHPDGAIEFRVFETCYDNPEMFYEYLSVISKCLEFYKRKYTPLPFFDKYGKLAFRDNSSYLERFFFSEKHVAALNDCLTVLCPDHKTVNQVKKERGFKLTKTELKRKEAKLEAQWRSEYRELKKRSEDKILIQQDLEKRENYRRIFGQEYDIYIANNIYNMSASRSAYVAHQMRARFGSESANKLKPLGQFLKDKKDKYSTSGASLTVTV